MWKIYPTNRIDFFQYVVLNIAGGDLITQAERATERCKEEASLDSLECLSGLIFLLNAKHFLIKFEGKVLVIFWLKIKSSLCEMNHEYFSFLTLYLAHRIEEDCSST